MVVLGKISFSRDVLGNKRFRDLVTHVSRVEARDEQQPSEGILRGGIVAGECLDRPIKNVSKRNTLLRP